MASLTAVVALHLSSKEQQQNTPSLGLVYERMEWSGNGTAESGKGIILRLLNGNLALRKWIVDQAKRERQTKTTCPSG